MEKIILCVVAITYILIYALFAVNDISDRIRYGRIRKGIILALSNILKNISNAKYIFTIVGGNWMSAHELYVITKDNFVYYTDDFNDIELKNPKAVYQLDKELDFIEHTHNEGFDGPTCIMYIVDDGQLKELYSVGMYNNTPALTEVMNMNPHQA